jgi:hypothetical protein
MKIAILFSGRINYYRRNYDNIIAKIVNNNDVDFYLSTTPDLTNENDLRDFIELYKPIKVINEPIEHEFDIYKFERLYYWMGTLNTLNTFNMWYNRMRIFNMIENKDDYDIIISYRLDLYAHHDINYEINNVLNIPIGEDHEGGYNDQIAYGNYDIMSKYMNLYLHIQDILSNCLMHPETILKNYINKFDIQLRRFEFLYYIVKIHNENSNVIECLKQKYTLKDDL